MAKTLTLEQYVSLCEEVTKFVRDFPPEQGRTVWGLPTIRMVATRFGIPQKQVLVICEDRCLLEYNIGIRTHSGYGVYPRIGDYLVEYVGEIE